jgi:microcystin-dependent protein
MNNPSRIQSSGPLRSALAIALAVAGIAMMSTNALAQAANPNPPARMTYQGFLVGSDGVALGNAAPKNYDVIFTLYNNESASAANNILWGEQQTVTVDKGYFSVLLGEGASVSGLAHADLSTLFKGSDASDRFVGITVKGIGVNGANVDITPRLRLLSSPYALLAQNAIKLVSNTGVEVITATDNVVTVAGGLNVTGTFNAGGTVPVGGIIMWSGTIANVPSGWALCNGQTVNGKVTPDLRDRFVIGAGNTYAVGTTGGGTNVTLTVSQMPAHTHAYIDQYQNLDASYNAPQGAYADNRFIMRVGNNNGVLNNGFSQTQSAGSSSPINVLNPYYALGYIMRVQ